MNSKKSTNSYDEFLNVLREYEIKTFSKFVCIKCEKAFTETKFTPNENMRIQWDGDMPQYNIGCKVYACHQGKDTDLSNKKKYAEKRDSRALRDHVFIERRKLAQPTKKLDCPVKIKVSRVLALPRFKITKLTQPEKVKMAELIKKKIEKGQAIFGENRYYFNLPDETDHQNHNVGLAAAVTETIDPRVRSKIKELVFQGERNISIIMALVEQYVINELGETDKLRSRFYPDRKCIRNIVNATKQQIRWSKTDLENVDEPMIEDVSADTSFLNSKETEYSKFDSRKSNKNKLISECKGTIRSLESAMFLLDEQYLENLKTDLEHMYEDATSHIIVDDET